MDTRVPVGVGSMRALLNFAYTKINDEFSVTAATVRFTEEFKKLAYGKKRQGVPVAETIRQCGIGPEVLGASRVEGFSYTLNRKAKQENGFSDGRSENRRHPATAGEETDSADFALVKQAYEFRGYGKGARSIYMRPLHLDPPAVMNIKKIRRLMRKY